ncbi:Quinic acid utilization activator, partial [Smittium culicis]
MKNHNRNISHNGPFKVMKIGKTFYSCSTCRERKVKCNGIRPTCNTCLMYDRVCNYQENTPTEVTKDVDNINKKLNRINAALKKISTISKAKNLKVSPENMKSVGIYNNLQDLFDLKNRINIEERDRLRVNCINKNYNSQESIEVQVLDLDAEIGLLLSKSALEFGYLDVEDDFIIKVVEKISKERILSTILSNDYIISRIKDKSLPAYMKFSILALGSKLSDGHTFFNGHFYMCGSTYAEKAFELLSSNLDQPNLDKIFTALALVIHYDAISKFSRSFYLVDLARRYAYLLRMNIMDASTNKGVSTKADWVFIEYKRRMWWFLYARSVIIGLNYGSVNKISPKDIAVNLPSHDYFFHNYNSDPSL